MSDWVYAQCHKSDELARLHYFSITMRQPSGDVEFVITVKEFAERNAQMMRYFACADKQTNQKVAPFTPCGWGETLLVALSECIKSIHRFPYEGGMD
jgi:hypothetical protein